MAWPHFANRRATEAARPVSAGDRALIDAAIAKGKITKCPTRDVRDTTPPGVFGVHPSERPEPGEVEALISRERDA